LEDETLTIKITIGEEPDRRRGPGPATPKLDQIAQDLLLEALRSDLRESRWCKLEAESTQMARCWQFRLRHVSSDLWTGSSFRIRTERQGVFLWVQVVPREAAKNGEEG
jgi:hypothetical protein